MDIFWAIVIGLWLISRLVGRWRAEGFAKFNGMCPYCRGRIKPGKPVVRGPQGVGHAHCTRGIR